jgi:hypothetical protein
MASAWTVFNQVFHRSNGRERTAARTQYATIVKNEVLRAAPAEEVGCSANSISSCAAAYSQGKEAETKGRT